MYSVARKCGRFLVVLVMATTSVVVLGDTPSWASVLSVPDATHGNSYANCNVRVSGTTPNTFITVWLSCQTYGTVATNVTSRIPYTQTNGTFAVAWVINCGSDCTNQRDDTSLFRQTANNIGLGTFGIDVNCGGAAYVIGHGAGPWSIGGNVSAVPAMLCPFSVGTGAPPYPSDWFPGGGAPPTVATVGTVACNADKPQVTGTDVVAQLSANPSGGTGVTGPTYAWTFGDGGTSTRQNPQHDYGALSSFPDGGYSVTVTATYTATAGHEFADGTTTATVTCSGIETLDGWSPGAGGGSPPPSDCPTGWGWLNPLALVKVLECLFVPDAAHITILSSLAGDMTTKAPLSWAYETVAFIPHIVGQISTGLQNSLAAGVGWGASNCFSVSDTGLRGLGVPVIHGPTVCGDDVSGWATVEDYGAFGHTSISPLIAVLRGAALVILVLLLAWEMWKLAKQVIGK